VQTLYTVSQKRDHIFDDKMNQYSELSIYKTDNTPKVL